MELTLIKEIEAERQAQDAKWGGASRDDSHSVFDWVSYIREHAFMAAYDNKPFRRQMVRVAALAIAAIESFDRKAG